MKKTKLSKAASLLLSLMLVLTLIPSAGAEMAFAADGGSETSTTASSIIIYDENGGMQGTYHTLNSETNMWDDESKGKASFEPGSGELTLENYNYNPISASSSGDNSTDITVVLSGANVIGGTQRENLSIVALRSANGKIHIKGDGDATPDSLKIDLTGADSGSQGVYGIDAKEIIIDGVNVEINVKKAPYVRYALYAENGIQIKNGAKLTINFDDKGKTVFYERGIHNENSGDIVIDNATVDVKTAAPSGNHCSMYNSSGGVKIKNGSRVTLDGSFVTGDSGTQSSELKGDAIKIEDKEKKSANNFIEISGQNTEVSVKNYNCAISEVVVGTETISPEFGTVVKDGAKLSVSNCNIGIYSIQGQKIENSHLDFSTKDVAIGFDNQSAKKSLNVRGASTVELKSKSSYALNVSNTACANFDLTAGGYVKLMTRSETKTQVLGNSFTLGVNTIVENEGNYKINKTQDPKWFLMSSDSQPDDWTADGDGYYSIKFVPNKTLTEISVAAESGTTGETSLSLDVPTKEDGTATMNFKATGTYDDKSTADITDSVTWTVTGSDNNPVNGVTIDKGKLTVAPNAPAGRVWIKANSGTYGCEATVNLTKAALKASEVKIFKDGEEVSTDTIIIPTTDTANTATYTAKVYDQYGNEMTGQTVNWTATVPDGDKVTFDAATQTLTVKQGATECNVVVKATLTTETADAPEGTVTVSVSDKTEIAIGGISAATNLVYDGTAKQGYTGTLTHEGWTGTTEDLVVTYYRVDGETEEQTTSDNSGAEANGGAPKYAGTYKVKLAIPADDSSCKGSTEVEFTIAPKALTKADLEYTGAITKEYDGDTTCSVSSVSVKSGVLASGDTLTVNGTAVYNSVNVYEANKVTFTPNAITSGNYSLEASEKLEIPAKITPKTVTPTVNVSECTFDGKEQKPNVTVKVGEKTLAEDDYNVTYSDNTNAGNAKVKVTAKDNRNYTWSTSVEESFTIEKATAVSLDEIETKVKYSNTEQQVVDLSGLMPDNAGSLGYAMGEATDNNSILAEGTNCSDDGKLTFTLNSGLTESGKAATIPVKISSTNYEDSTVNVQVTTVDKDVPTLTATDITVEYTGSPVPNTAITGTATFNGADVAGTWAFKDTAPTNVSESGDKTVVFTPEDSDNYEVTSTQIHVNITKAKPSVTPKFDKVTESGKKLSDVSLTVEGSVTGSIAWTVSDDTLVEANKEYEWKFTPSIPANYEEVTGKVVVWTNTSGGGAAAGGAIGGGALPMPTTEKPEITIDNTQGKLELSADGTTANITANEGYEIEKVTVNGVDKGAVNKLTGLKTGDKVVVSFKSTAPAAGDSAALETIKEKVAKLQFKARSSKTSKKNVKLTLKFDSKTSAEIDEFKSLGYTVKYKFYRSTKKSSSYKAVLTKTSKTYTNTKGVKGTKYYYKARVQVFDKDGKLVAQTALKQCKYASRTWTK